MPVFPMMQLQDPRERMLGNLGQAIGGAATKGFENKTLQDIMQGVDLNDPSTIQNILQRTPPQLQAKVSALLSEQLQLKNMSEVQGRQKEEFETGQKINKLKLAEAERVQDQQFTGLVDQKLGDVDDLTKGAFNELSKKHSNELNPESRYQKTLKDYTGQLKSVQRLTDKVNKVSDFRKGFVGLKDSDINALSSDIQRLKKDGVDERIIRSSLDPQKTGINERDFDAIMMPNYRQVKKITDSIKPLKFTEGTGRGQKELQAETTDKLTSKVASAIKKGGSLDFIYTQLLEKGYSDEIANEVMRDAAISSDLNPAQEIQLNNLVQKRQALLGRIFGV